MKADLHCHTTLSDGSLGIEEVIALAKRKGLDYLAITDHDTLSSFSRASVLGKRYGVTIIPAVEFTAFDSKRGAKAHILCYNPKKPNRLEGLCMRTCDARKTRGKKMAMKIIEKYNISFENIVKYAAGSKAIYKCHIMHALMDYGYTIDLYGKIHNEMFNPNDGVCAEEVRGESDEYPEVRFVLQLIRSAGGIAVLAHPRVYDNFELLEELAKDGMIDGVELWHSSLKEGDDARINEIASEFDLIVTGGSDFHGFYNHYPVSMGHGITSEQSLQRILTKKEVHKV